MRQPLSPGRDGTRRPANALHICLPLALLTLVPLSTAIPVWAQGPEKRSYIHFPFSGDLEKRLGQQLANARGREEFDKLLQEFAHNPKLDSAEAEKLKALYETNPLVRSQINDLISKAAENSALDPALRKNLKLFLKQQQSAASAGQEPPILDPDKIGPTTPPGPGTPHWPNAPQPPESTDDPEAGGDGALAEWFRDWIEETEDSQFGDLLRQSPTFQRGMLDLQRSLLERRDDGAHFSSTAVGKFLRMRPPEGWEFSRLQNLWSKMGDLPTPSLSVPQLGWDNGLSWGAPALPSPSASLGRMVLWLMLVGGLVLLLRQILSRSGVKARAQAAAWQLGPWPVQPAEICNRGELILAFDYLSLLLLGPEARSRNHRAIAAGLAGMDDQSVSERRQAANELAFLYEQARYAPIEEPLSPEALAVARRDLCLLAGVHNG